MNYYTLISASQKDTSDVSLSLWYGGHIQIELPTLISEISLKKHSSRYQDSLAQVPLMQAPLVNEVFGMLSDSHQVAVSGRRF